MGTGCSTKLVMLVPRWCVISGGKVYIPYPLGPLRPEKASHLPPCLRHFEGLGFPGVDGTTLVYLGQEIRGLVNLLHAQEAAFLPRYLLSCAVGIQANPSCLDKRKFAPQTL